MKFNNSLENFPSPVIAIDNNMFVAAKNYLASLTFPNIHVGAKISNYTNIDVSKEIFAKGTFYGSEYTYFTCSSQIDGDNYTLLFISLATFGEDLLPFNPISLYKEKALDACNTPEESKNKKRQYIRSIHNNLIKANYFECFHAIFQHKSKSDSKETVELKKVCSALEMITNNFLNNIDILVKFDYTLPSLIASVSEINMTALLINSLLFSVINSNDGIEITLTCENEIANIAFGFCGNFDFFEIYNCNDFNKNGIINSAFSLCIAMELAKRSNIKYTIEKENIKNKIHYTINHSMPIRKQSQINLASQDTLVSTFENYLLTVFFDETL